ncbi:MAG: hypothetical protein KC454_04700 [Flavobacteriales bacterium]|nr:hypothetical protein [Flavobacteriales bacterium]
MKFRTIFHVLLLLFALTTANCGSVGPKNNPTSVAEAEKQLAKNNKKANRKGRKARKESDKRYWRAQSKESKKSIKKNKKRNKRIARHKKRR